MGQEYERDELVDGVVERLAPLAPRREEAPRPPGQMLAQLKNQVEAKTSRPTWWRMQDMLNRKFAFGAVLALLLVIILAFSPVRAAASEFLGLFRVQKFAAISVSPSQLAMLERISQEGLYPGELEIISEPGEPQLLGSLEEAASVSGYTVRTVTTLGSPSAIRFSEGAQGRLTIDLAGARAILRLADVDPTLLPDSLDGADVDVTIYPTIEQEWGQEVVLVQTESPLVDYPADVEPAVLGEALLRFLGMTPSEAHRLARNIDWTNTLLLPVPENLATFSEVRVNGVSGLGLSSLDGQGSSVMWEKDGIVFLLTGNGMSLDALREIANAVK